MDRMPSSEFRKSFARLDRLVDVTVLGHVIGRWIPGVQSEPAVSPPGQEEPRAFRPAPKPGRAPGMKARR